MTPLLAVSLFHVSVAMNLCDGSTTVVRFSQGAHESGLVTSAVFGQHPTVPLLLLGKVVNVAVPELAARQLDRGGTQRHRRSLA